ncbi:MAG TPA: patatin-like phospholipase family protein [Rickettsia endosymbiont of Omalisus fontisbellaquei]|nr:patatin-like phospholipase family protein [Rickettsia endosymbiont of Omalisus fontisbellaquei]
MADIKVRKHPIINNLKQESKTPIVNEQSDILEELEDLEKIQKSSSNQTKTLQELEQAQKAPIEYIAFSGGGAKGAIYSGAYEAAKKAGILDNVKAVAGSSAGAITAAVVALGTKPERFEEISKNTNLQDLLGKKGFSAGIVQLNKDGKPLYDLLDLVIKENIGNFLQRSDIVNVKGDEVLDELRKRYQENGKIYFKDIALLRKYDPVQYKDLVITATQQETSELTIFSSVDTPDVEIALACRASASIPIVFEPVEIDGKKYVDGGYRDNIPTKYFKGNEPEFDTKEVTDDMEEITLAKKQGRTLAMAFGVGMEADANIAIYSAKKFESPSDIVKFLADVLFKTLAKVGGKFKYTETLKETNEQLRENALNTVVLDTAGIDTLDFKDAQKYSDYLHIKGYCQTREYLNNHELGKKTDKTFDHQKFLLNVYEVYDNKNLHKTFGAKLLEMFIPSKENNNSKWQDGVIENHNDKAKMLLSFCKTGALNEKELQKDLKEYVIIAATSRNNTLKADTNSLKALLHTLNDPTASSKIKDSFIEVLGIDKNKDARFDKTKTFDENIAKFKFTKQDLESFITKSKSEAPKIQNKHEVASSQRSRG